MRAGEPLGARASPLGNIPNQESSMPTKKVKPTRNDQRSNVKNPNNNAFKHARDNRANQLNPNHAATKRGSKHK